MHAASMSFSVFLSILFSLILLILPKQDPHSIKPRADQVSISNFISCPFDSTFLGNQSGPKPQILLQCSKDLNSR